jgi:hypothetical protein
MGGNQLRFDFSEFAGDAGQKEHKAGTDARPRDFPFEAAFNRPPEQPFSGILDKKIELNKNHAPTKRGWKTLNNLLSV